MKFANLFRLATYYTVITFTLSQANAQPGNIRLNQIGFYPAGPKIAIVLDENVSNYTLTDSTGRQLFSGKLIAAANKTLAGKTAYIANFSSFHQPGKYHIKLTNGDVSAPFAIADNVHHRVAAGVMKAFYYQRASIPLLEKYAGRWHRAEGHPDNRVLIHASAANINRPVGMLVSSPRGWYDAGDYNKYVVNSGISMGTMLSFCEDFPAYTRNLHLNIPESGNNVPDMLKELLWNLRWMLTMQDPTDGGVYHKLTNATFDAMEMPDKATAPRYVVAKSTAAALDFAAVMAQAGRIAKAYPNQLPGLADSCLAAAKQAWNWSVKNPAVLYEQEKMNQTYQPAIKTGEYGDQYLKDEWIWAACELHISLHDDQYLNAVNILPDDTMPIPSWAQVKLLGYYSLLRNQKQLSPAGRNLANQIKPRLLKLADELLRNSESTAYQTVIGITGKDFVWGSNNKAANQGIALIQAYQLTAKNVYLSAALSNLDYILGRNGTGYSYVTGFGSKTPMHPHHRPSVADGIVPPVPGLLVGGPNPGMQDKIQVPSLVPDEAYIDDDRAYAVNEIAINWNAPMVYLANAIEALQHQWKN